MSEEIQPSDQTSKSAPLPDSTDNESIPSNSKKGSSRESVFLPSTEEDWLSYMQSARASLEREIEQERQLDEHKREKESAEESEIIDQKSAEIIQSARTSAQDQVIQERNYLTDLRRRKGGSKRAPKSKPPSKE